MLAKMFSQAVTQKDTKLLQDILETKSVEDLDTVLVEINSEVSTQTEDLKQEDLKPDQYTLNDFLEQCKIENAVSVDPTPKPTIKSKTTIKDELIARKLPVKVVDNIKVDSSLPEPVCVSLDCDMFYNSGLPACNTLPSIMPGRSPVGKWTPEYIASLTYKDIKQMCKEVIDGPLVKATACRFMSPEKMGDFTGNYHITFTSDIWDGFIGELENGFCAGVGKLYKITNDNKLMYSEGVFTKSQYNQCKPTKGEYVTGSKYRALYENGKSKMIIERGTFNNGVLNGPDCLTHYIQDKKIVASFEGEFKHGGFTKGKSYIFKTDIMFENQSATIVKSLLTEESYITLNNGTKITCNVAGFPYSNVCKIQQLHKITLPDGCTVIPTVGLSVLTMDHSSLENIFGNTITSLTNCKFNFPAKFTNNMYQKWDPFTLKCYLLVHFQGFSSTFFSSMTRDVTNKQMLHQMVEKHYISLGLTCTQYLQLETELGERFGEQ